MATLMTSTSALSNQLKTTINVPNTETTALMTTLSTLMTAANDVMTTINLKQNTSAFISTISVLINATLSPSPNGTTVYFDPTDPYNIWPNYKPGLFEISTELYFDFAYYSNAIYTPIICIIGFSGNLLGAFVIFKDIKKQNQSIYIYMLALLITDMAFLFNGIIFGVFANIEQYDWYLANWYYVYTSFFNGYLDFYTYHVSSLLLLIMATERLHALMSPFTFRNSLPSKYPYHFIIAVVITLALVMLPFPFFHKVVTAKGMYNETIYYLFLKPELSSFHEKYSLFESIFACAYPVLMLGLNIAIVVAFRRVQARRKASLKHTSLDDRTQIKITLMVLAVAIFYTVLSIPKIFIQVLTLVDPRYNYDSMYGLTFYFISFIGDNLQRLNAANDFFIYVLVSDHYRRIIRIMFCRRCISEEEVNEWSEFQSTARSTAKHSSKSVD